MSSTSSTSKQILDIDISALEDTIRMLADPLESQKFTTMNNGLEIAAKYLWLMRAYACERVTDYIGDNAATVRRFFNETVAFIINGKRRPIRIESWDGIIRDIATQYDVDQMQIGNIGALSVTRSVERRGLTAVRVGHVDLDKDLLSYAHHEIMLKWITREDGAYDMLKTILLLASIYKRYFPNGDGSAGITVSQAPAKNPNYSE